VAGTLKQVLAMSMCLVLARHFIMLHAAVLMFRLGYKHVYYTAVNNCFWD
jgi:hypothetical protein